MYCGRVSGPQLAVPSPRCAASRWMTVVADRLELDVVAGRVEVGGPEVRRRDLARRSEDDPQPVPGGVAELEPADVGVPAVLLRPDVAHGLVGDAALPAPEQPTALPVRVRLVGTRAEPGDAASSPGTVSRTVPTRATSVSSSGMTTSSSIRIAAAGERAEPLLVADGDPRRAPVGAPDDRRGAIAIDRVEGSLAAGRGPSATHRAPIPPIRSLSVGARHRLSVGGAASERMDEQAGGVELDRRPGVGPAGSTGSGGRRAGCAGRRELGRADLEAGRRPGQLDRGHEAQRQPGVLPRRKARRSASPAQATVCARARPDRRQIELARGDGCPTRSPGPRSRPASRGRARTAGS